MARIVVALIVTAWISGVSSELRGTAVAGENYALLVAVGSYDVKELRPLKYTRSDVLDFHTALVESGFKERNIVLMHDDLKKLVDHYSVLGPDFDPKNYLPLGANIRKRLELLLGRLRPDDSIVVAFSGHGVQFKDEKKSYFCPSDAVLTKKDSLIGFDEVFATLKDCDAGRKLFVVDACQNDPLSEIAKSRSSVDLDSVTRPQTERIPEGIIALFSCKAGQKSYESPEIGHGVFFYHFLEGWKGGADRNNDGRISYRELAEHAEIKTAEYADLKLGALQTPLLRTEFSGDWVIRDLRKKPAAPFDATTPRTPNEVKTAQSDWAKELGTPVEIENRIGMKIRLIPPGEYLRGITDEQAKAVLKSDDRFRKEWTDAEQPQHRVKLSQPFFLGAMEVTRGQFARFVKATNYKTDAEKLNGGDGFDLETKQRSRGSEFSWQNVGFPQTDDHPVSNVSWNDAVEFCKWLGTQEGRTYRLPTEAEWEYCCRAGTQTWFSTGDDGESLEKFANVADQSNKRTSQPIDPPYPYTKFDDGFALSSPVGKFLPNAFGLFDMHGNNMEWCSDRYDGQEYKKFANSLAVDPTGSEDAFHRVTRGGSYHAVPILMRSSNRAQRAPYERTDMLGFRVVAEIQ